MKKINSVCVYCASSSKINDSYFKAARELGRLLAKNNIRCVYGAGNQGLMGTLADETLSDGGNVLGVIPRFMQTEGWCHKELKNIIVTENMHERKNRMAEESDGIIALPGGCGTMEELLEIITWKQLGLYLHPIVILNINGFYNPLIQLLEQAINENFMRPEHSRMWCVAYTPQEAIEALYNAPEWDGKLRKIAAI